MNEVRVAVIGAGYWGPNLVRNLNEAPGAEPVAVADLSDTRLDTIRKRFPAVRTTNDHRELFADSSIDAVCIATPVGTHRRLSKRPSRQASMSSWRSRSPEASRTPRRSSAPAKARERP